MLLISEWEKGEGGTPVVATKHSICPCTLILLPKKKNIWGNDIG